MFTLPLAARSAVPATTSAIAADDGANRADIGDDFATLLGMQVAIAAGETKAGPVLARPALPRGGKVLPEVARAEPETADTASPEFPVTDEPTPLPQIALSALPIEAFARGTAIPAEPAAMPVFAASATRLVAAPPAILTPLATDGSKPLGADAQLTVIQPENPTFHTRSQTPATEAEPDRGSAIPPEPERDIAEKPAPGRPSAAPQFSVPAQAAARAVLVHGVEAGLTVDPIKPAPVLPERAAAQATIALAARGNSERPARVRPGPAIALPTDAATQAALPLAPLRPLKAVLAERALSADLPPALVAAPAQGDPQSVPQAAAPAPSAPPTLARHDFAAVIDRLIEARDLAGAQPVAMTLRHADFGAVSLDFRPADDGLTVTMASPDPDFARAVSAAAAAGAANNPGDAARQGGEFASSRQHGSGSAGDDHAGEPPAGSREAEREGSRQRRNQAPPQGSAPRQQGRSGIFA